MTRTISINATTLATLALSLLGIVNAIGSVESYTGSICKDYVDYQVWVPPNSTISTIEGNLTQNGMNDQNLETIPPTCLEPFMKFVCSSNFPRYVPTPTPNSLNVMFACKSTCTDVATKCSAAFANSVDKLFSVPDCNSPIDGTIQSIPPYGILYQPDGSCNVVSNLKSAAGNQTSVACIPPFIPDTMKGPGGTTTSQDSCFSGCCLPCPAQYSLYHEGILDTGYMVSDITRTVSMIFSGFLIMSYLILPNKMSHPSIMVFCQILGAFLFSVVGAISLANRRGGQCLDEIVQSTQQNNSRCAIQGAMQVFSAALFCVWVSAVTLNLHLQTVWNSAWFARNNILTHVICWGISITLMVLTLSMGDIQWNTGSYCFISQKTAPELFFYPMAVVLFPSFLIHFWTIIHITRIMFQNGSTPSASSRSTVSAGGTPSISHYQHVLTIVKMQWRAALMASLSILFVTFYWIFYIFQFRKMNPDILRPNIEKYFITCLMSGGTQNTCADVLAPYLPPYALMIAAEVLVSAAGTTSFIVFFKPSFVGEWRERFGLTRYRGKNADEEEFVAM